MIWMGDAGGDRLVSTARHQREGLQFAARPIRSARRCRQVDRGTTVPRSSLKGTASTRSSVGVTCAFFVCDKEEDKEAALETPAARQPRCSQLKLATRPDGAFTMKALTAPPATRTTRSTAAALMLWQPRLGSRKARSNCATPASAMCWSMAAESGRRRARPRQHAPLHPRGDAAVQLRGAGTGRANKGDRHEDPQPLHRTLTARSAFPRHRDRLGRAAASRQQLSKKLPANGVTFRETEAEHNID